MPALMAGNAVLLKHAAQTLLVGERFQRAFDAAGLPRGAVPEHRADPRADGGADRARAVDQVNFTGSVAGGRAIEGGGGAVPRRRAGARRQGPGLCARRRRSRPGDRNVVDGAFFNSGQSCCGIERVYVDARVYDAFVEGAVALTKTTCSAIRSTRRRRWGRWCGLPPPSSCAARSPRRARRAGAPDRPRSFARDAEGRRTWRRRSSSTSRTRWR